MDEDGAFKVASPTIFSIVGASTRTNNHLK
jgi:hypothetical protein